MRPTQAVVTLSPTPPFSHQIYNFLSGQPIAAQPDYPLCMMQTQRKVQ